jgi:Sulfotransferase family
MSNIIDIQDKVLFFGLPKSGLTSMDHFCILNEIKTMKVQFVYPVVSSITDYKKLFPKHIFFIIVRNPWHRIVSMYFYWKRTMNVNNMFKMLLNLDEAPTFTEFVKLLPTIKGSGWGLSTHFNILKAKVEDFDIVIKLEEIDEKFEQIQNILGAKISIRQSNKGDYEGSYQQYYTDETRDLIAEYFKYEIDTFGYTF